MHFNSTQNRTQTRWFFFCGLKINNKTYFFLFFRAASADFLRKQKRKNLKTAKLFHRMRREKCFSFLLFGRIFCVLWVKKAARELFFPSFFWCSFFGLLAENILFTSTKQWKMMNFDCVRGRENLFSGELELLPGTLPVTTSEKVF